MRTSTRWLAVAVASGLVIGVVVADRSSATTSSSMPDGDGVIRVRSAHAFDETVARVKKDVEGKGIMHFGTVEQSRLAAAAGIRLLPSTLIVFGNPGLGNQFLTSNPSAGLDWPVRLLVTEDAVGQVWVHYTDFRWIAARHQIRDRDAQFNMASEVISSITASVARR